MLKAVKRGDDPAAERSAKKGQPRWEDLLVAFRSKFLPKKRPTTRKRYNAAIDSFLTPAFKGKRVSDISTPMIAAMYARRAATPADANVMMRTLSKMMSFAIGEGMRPDRLNPVQGHRTLQEPGAGALARRAELVICGRARKGAGRRRARSVAIPSDRLAGD
jgi:hypothetical protein